LTNLQHGIFPKHPHGKMGGKIQSTSSIRLAHKGGILPEQFGHKVTVFKC
jgi:hypothetical protein